MNKKLRELLEAIKAKSAELEAAKSDEARVDEVKSIAVELEGLMEDYKTEKTAFEAEKLASSAIEEPEAVSKDLEDTKKAADGFVAISKLLKKQPLDETEKALLAIGGTSGEGNLLPEDV